MKKNNYEDVIRVKSFLAFSITGIILIAVGYALSFIPDKLDTELIKNLYNLPLDAFYPEKSETYQYMIISVSFPILFCLFYLILSNKINNFNFMKLSKIIYPTELLLFLILFSAVTIKKYKFFWVLFPKFNIALMILSIIIILTTVFLFKESTNKSYKIINIGIFIFGVITVFFTSWLFISNNYFFNEYTIHHFDAYYYPVYEVLNGKTLDVDFNSLYGFYPYLMVWIFKLLGGISMYRFSIFMAILVLINCASIGLAIWINVKNKIIALIGFLASIFYLYIFNLSSIGGYFLQYFPHRTIFPSLLILGCSIWLNTNNLNYRKILTFIGYVLCSISLLWNIDTGFVVVAGWSLFLFYNESLTYSFNDKQLYFQVFKIIWKTTLSTLIAFFSVVLITYLRTGQLIGPKGMMSSQILFKGTGFYMLPMPLFHPWLLLVVIYAIGLAKSLRNLSFLSNSDNEFSKPRSSIYFLLSIAGIGLFSYYQGRSHDIIFRFVVWPAILLVTIFADEYLTKISDQSKIYQQTDSTFKIRVKTDLLKLVLIIVVLSTLSVSFFVQSYKNKFINNLISKDSIIDSKEVPFRENLNFIKKNSLKNEKIDLLLLYFTEYYSILNLQNPMPISSQVDWFTKEDYKKVIRWLEITDHKLFIDKDISYLLTQYMPEEYSKVISRRFRLVDTYNDIKCYEVKNK